MDWRRFHVANHPHDFTIFIVNILVTGFAESVRPGRERQALDPALRLPPHPAVASPARSFARRPAPRVVMTVRSPGLGLTHKPAPSREPTSLRGWSVSSPSFTTAIVIFISWLEQHPALRATSSKGICSAVLHKNRSFEQARRTLRPDSISKLRYRGCVDVLPGPRRPVRRRLPYLRRAGRE